MKKLKRWERLLLALALAAALFTAGFLAGRRTAPVSVQTEQGAEPLRLAPESETKPVNVNTADEGTLTLLPGIGPVLARRIVEYRESRGPFSRVEELQRVKGISYATVARLRDRITVD